MSHEIDEKIDTVYAPNSDMWRSMWHNLQTIAEGTRIELDGSNIPLVFDPIIELGLNPQGSEEMEISEEMRAELNKWKLIAADCRKGKSGKIHPLHVPKEGYQIHDNRLLFDTMIEAAKLVLGDAFEIVSAGTLGGYTQFFVSLAIQGKTDFAVGMLANGSPDRYKRFFNLFSSHNSIMASQFMASIIRIVCMNTAKASSYEAEASGQNLKLYHSKNSLELVTPENIAEALQAWENDNEAFEKLLTAIQSEPMSVDEFRFFACGVFTQDQTDVLTTTSQNRVNELLELFQRGRGNSGKSEYDAFNAFTEYFTSGNGVGKKSSPAQKIAKANFGQGANWKEKAAFVLANREEFADAMKRGERLWNDKMLIDAKKTES